jgi:carboxylesterase type B
LNIWTKTISKTHPRRSKKPVFAFFHGGRFTIPGPNSPFYNGQYLADSEDVVLVTINYRLGIFGFSGAPDIEQNAGLRDQRSATEWLRDNIAGFGGDPDRIIIFGQSAGGSAVDYWAYAYQNDPIVAGIISHSGTALSFIPNTVEYSRSIYNNVTSTVGCGNITTDTLSCLRSKNMTEILAAARNVPALPTQALAQAAFHPTIDNITVFSDYASLGKAGAFAKIPYLAGNGDYEAGFYRVSAFNANITLSPEKWELFNERAFTCPTKYAADFRVAHGVPTRRYRYMGDFDNLRLYDGWGEYPDSGAYHGSDLSELFGTAQNVTGQPSTAEQEQFSRYMQGAWAAFGRDPKGGLTEYGWPGYNSGVESLIRLAPGKSAASEVVDPAVYDERCPQVEDNDPRPGRGAF